MNYFKKCRLPAVLLLQIGTFAVFPYAYAQTNQIDEITVTVERREQSLQDVAGTAASFSGEELKILGVQNINDLDGNLPGLSIANNAGNIEVYIRGIGSSNNTELGDPAAATHLDGVYVPRPSGFGAAFFDIQRVEVNIGPQGTLRGRNATAGSINVIPFKPGLGVFDGMAELSFGNYGETRAEGMVNVPVTENSAFRVAGFTLSHDSYYTNANPDSADLGVGVPTSEREGIEVAEAADDAGIRTTYLIDGLGDGALDDLKLTFTYDYIEQKGTGYTGTNYASLLGADLDPDSVDDPRKVYVRPISPKEDTEHWGIKGQLDYSTEWFDVEYTVSHRDLVYDYRWGGAADTVAYPGALTTRLDNGNTQIDFDFDKFDRVHQITDSESDIHEIRLFSETLGDLPLQWTAGTFLFEEQQRTFLGTVGDRNQFFSGVEFNQRTETDSNSFYTDLTYSATDRFRLTGGARYTEDEKTRTGVNARYRFVLGGAGFADNAFTSVGTEGFRFKGLDRTIINPDTDGDGEVSQAEAIAFYLDGVAQFGDRDGLGQVLANGPVGGGDPVDQHPLCPDIYGGAGCPVADGSDPTFDDHLDGRVAYVVPVSVIALQNGELDNDFVDWRIRPEFDITEDNLVYGLVATGHKSGGFNDNVPTVTPAPPPADPSDPTPPPRITFDGTGTAPTYDEEKVTLYEIGSKNEFRLDNLLGMSDVGVRFNASAFYYDYTDLQVTNLVSTAQIIDFAGLTGGDPQALVDSGAGDNIVSFTFNASDAEIYGMQFDGGFQFPRNINFDYTFLWLQEAEIENSRTVQDSRFDPTAQFGDCLPVVTDACNAREQSIEGHRLPRTPEYQFNASLSKVFELDNGGSIDAIISAGYRSSQHMTIFNGRVYNDGLSDLEKRRLDDKVEGYWTYDVGAGYTYELAGGEFRAEAYISNLTDEQQPQAIVITQRDNTRFFSRPRTMGLRLRVLF